MNEAQHTLILTVMDMINGTLENYARDPHHAPAAWLLENWWCTLNGVLQIGDHGQGEPDSFETTHNAKREKRHE